MNQKYSRMSMILLLATKKSYFITQNNIDYMIGDMICFKNMQENKEVCFKITSISKDCIGLTNGYCVIGW